MKDTSCTDFCKNPNGENSLGDLAVRQLKQNA
jgi:hypothetical protein